MPKVKKPKSSSDSDSGPEDRNPEPAAKKAKTNTDSAGGGTKGGSGNQWTLEKLRQVRVNEFRGRQTVDIREFYEKGGEILPGKKGISLTIAQWKKLIELAPEINAALNE